MKRTVKTALISFTVMAGAGIGATVAAWLAKPEPITIVAEEAHRADADAFTSSIGLDTAKRVVKLPALVVPAPEVDIALDPEDPVYCAENPNATDDDAPTIICEVALTKSVAAR